MLVPRLGPLHESVSVLRASGSGTAFYGETVAFATHFRFGRQNRHLNSVPYFSCDFWLLSQQSVAQRVIGCGRSCLFDVKHESPIVGYVEKGTAVTTAATGAAGAIDKAD